eukprot:TRINITY_DN11257_c0_g1_i6.p1 TRINITY_DN11257_c0_g1~~TRINITY_DN11257_c0_g1_i6.p1  ORF type:complete len:488 (-),score=142.22 TRINITY_DN11257_c0_g1_i6:37-1371(-)
MAFSLEVLKNLPSDAALLFLMRFLRLLAYGFVGLILMLYLSALGLSDPSIGALFTLTLFGDALISLLITAYADHLGRRLMMKVGIALMVGAGTVFLMTKNFWVLVLAATIGVISPSGTEIGPFTALEQAVLSQLVPSADHTAVFAWYGLVGMCATAIGVLLGGWFVHVLIHSFNYAPLDAYRCVLFSYVAIGLLLLVCASRLSEAIELAVPANAPVVFKSSCGDCGFSRLRPKSRIVVLKLSLLFAMDSFAGGLLLQSFISFWYNAKYDVSTAVLGNMMFGANVLAAISALSASAMATRVGLINTMVFTHLPSNIFLVLIPLMPNMGLAILILLLRFSISQMDVPTRQAFTVAAVEADERTITTGITNIIRSVGAGLSPYLAGVLVASKASFDYPFYLAGGLKIIYDLLVYWQFKDFEKKPTPAPAPVSPAPEDDQEEIELLAK